MLLPSVLLPSVLLPPVLIMGHAITRPRQPADTIPTHPATKTVDGLKVDLETWCHIITAQFGAKFFDKEEAVTTE